MKEILKDLLSIRLYRCILAFVFVVVMIFSFTHVKYITASNEMYPFFDEGETLICIQTSSFSYGDVVAYKSQLEGSDAYIIRRVYGLPGDTVYISDGTVYINDEPITDLYAYYDSSKEGYLEGVTRVLGDDEYFLMGDNRNYSIDSRVIGGISEDIIYGKVVFSVTDFSFVE